MLGGLSLSGGQGDPEDIANACNQFVNEVTMPLHMRLTDEDVEYVIGNFVEVLRG